MIGEIIVFTPENRQNAHNDIDHIFKDVLPAQGMAERPEQVALSHRMLDAMLDGSIALCDCKQSSKKGQISPVSIPSAG